MNNQALKKLIRRDLLEIKSYTSARHMHQNGILLDANENAFGSVVEAPFGLKFNRYPDPFSFALKKELSKYLKVSDENLFIGVGSDEIIDLLIRLFVEQDEEIMVLEPTYGMYRVAADIAGVRTKTVLLDSNFQVDFAALKKAITKKMKIVFLCSPNNPTGNLLDEKSIIQVVKMFHGLVVLDEAYIEFASKTSLASKVKLYPNLIVLRTFSKAWGLAGLRIGYSISSPFIVEYLNKIKPPYNMNVFSGHIALKAVKAKNKMLAFRKQMLAERKIVAGAFVSMGCKVFKSEANFILVQVKNAAEKVKVLADKHQIIVRDVSTKPLLGDCLRVSVGTPAQNQKLIKVFRSFS